MKIASVLAVTATLVDARPSTWDREAQVAPPAPPGSCAYPSNCPNQVLPRPDKQTWQMNLSTIIQPCNNTGYTDPESTKGWGIVDCE